MLIFGFHSLFSEIWARFLAFESNIGDLASILKVERRRFTAFKDEYEGKETALLVDRYKFMDLYPCSASELKALGYKVCMLPFKDDTTVIQIWLFAQLIFKQFLLCVRRTCLVPNWQRCSQRLWWRPLHLH